MPPAKMDEEETHYEVLDLEENATSDDIRRSFRRKALECHPDKHPNNAVKMEQFQRLQAAHATLCDAESRKKYDTELQAKGPAWREQRKKRAERRKVEREVSDWWVSITALLEKVQRTQQEWKTEEARSRQQKEEERNALQSIDAKLSRIAEKLKTAQREELQRGKVTSPSSGSTPSTRGRSREQGSGSAGHRRPSMDGREEPSSNEFVSPVGNGNEMSEIALRRQRFLESMRAGGDAPTVNGRGADSVETRTAVQHFIKRLRKHRRRHLSDLMLLQSTQPQQSRIVGRTA